MKNEHKLEEFYCASNSSQPVHISSYHSDEIQSMAPLCPKRASCKLGHDKITVTESKVIGTPNNKLKESNNNRVNSTFKQLEVPVEESDLKFGKSLNVGDFDEFSDINMLKEKSKTIVLTEKELKKQLAESLSPSPFRNEDPNKCEERLEYLIASAPGTTKNIIFFPFYGDEMMGEGSHRVWKIALKDHIVHTLESICLIKKLIPVPVHIIEKRKVTIESLDPSII